jgi:hypothetical protein
MSEQQSSQGGGGGVGDALLGQFAAEFGIELGQQEEKADIEFQDEPWVEREAIKWRMVNKGKATSGSLPVYYTVFDQDASVTVVNKDATESGLPEGEMKDYEFSLSDFNQLAEDNWAMSGRDYWSQLNEDHRYRFEVYVDAGDGWGDPVSIEFGIEIDEDGEDDLSEDDDDRGRDDDIERLQEYLRQLGYYDGEVDRRFGPKTSEAVRRMQRDYGHPEDGRVNRRFRRTMKASEEFPKAAGFTY